jgi:SAM-dependent methyltransferase
MNKIQQKRNIRLDGGVNEDVKHITPSSHWKNRSNGSRVCISQTQTPNAIKFAHMDDNGVWLWTTEMEENKFIEDYEIILVEDEFKASLPSRIKTLIENHKSNFKKRSVLEIGALTGDMSIEISKYARDLIMVENNYWAIKELKQQKFHCKSKIIERDIHDYLKYPDKDIDVIVCCGFIYHTAHPFWILEQIAKIQPQAILIDTLDAQLGANAIKLTKEPVNCANHRQNHTIDCGFSIQINFKIIEKAMKKLGYEKCLTVNKSGSVLQAKLKGNYFENWRKSNSKWFFKNETV